MEKSKDLTARTSDVGGMLCEKPAIDLTHDAMASSREFPAEELHKRGALELEHLIRCEAFDEVHDSPRGHKAFDMVCIDEWRRDKVRSKVCVQPFTAEQSRDDKFAGTPETFFMRHLICRAANAQCLGNLGPGHQCSVLACSDRRRNVRGNKWRHHVGSILAVEGCNQWTT